MSLKFKIVAVLMYSLEEIRILDCMYSVLDCLDTSWLTYVDGIIALGILHLDVRHPL